MYSNPNLSISLPASDNIITTYKEEWDYPVSWANTRFLTSLIYNLFYHIKWFLIIRFYIILSENKIKDAEKFETCDYGWLMVHDEDMIMYVWEVKIFFQDVFIHRSRLRFWRLPSNLIFIYSWYISFSKTNINQIIWVKLGTRNYIKHIFSVQYISLSYYDIFSKWM